MRLGTRLRAASARRGLDFEPELRNDRDKEILAEIFSRRCYAPRLPITATRVLDLGANIGLFSAYAIGNLGAREIVAVEPDPENLRALRRFVAVNGFPVQIVEAFAGAADGEIEFEAGLAANSRIAGPDSRREATITVPVIDTFALGTFDLAKIDIEGGEWQLLADRRFPELAPTIVMEWHERGRGDLDIDDALKTHGYTVEHVDRWLVWARRPAR